MPAPDMDALALHELLVPELDLQIALRDTENSSLKLALTHITTLCDALNLAKEPVGMYWQKCRKSLPVWFLEAIAERWRVIV
jgi:hypothetical protein